MARKSVSHKDEIVEELKKGVGILGSTEIRTRIGYLCSYISVMK
jgi:hypothetical protein